MATCNWFWYPIKLLHNYCFGYYKNLMLLGNSWSAPFRPRLQFQKLLMILQGCENAFRIMDQCTQAGFIVSTKWKEGIIEFLCNFITLLTLSKYIATYLELLLVQWSVWQDVFWSLAKIWAGFGLLCFIFVSIPIFVPLYYALMKSYVLYSWIGSWIKLCFIFLYD